jgi:hypothetical protein
MYTNTPLALIPTPKFETGKARRYHPSGTHHADTMPCHALLTALLSSG